MKVRSLIRLDLVSIQAHYSKVEIFQDEFNLVATDLDLERRVKSMSQFLFDTYMMCGKRESVAIGCRRMKPIYGHFLWIVKGRVDKCTFASEVFFPQRVPSGQYMQFCYNYCISDSFVGVVKKTANCHDLSV